MSHNYPRPQQGRHAFLSILLTVLALGFVLLSLISISGIFLYVVLVFGLILFVALVHYALWGRAFSAQVAGEREEELLRQRAAEKEPESEDNPPDTRIRR